MTTDRCIGHWMNEEARQEPLVAARCRVSVSHRQATPTLADSGWGHCCDKGIGLHSNQSWTIIGATMVDHYSHNDRAYTRISPFV
jgi:hypothetical protein